MRENSALVCIRCNRASALGTTSPFWKILSSSAARAGKGTFLWDGIAGTWFWIDPSNDVVFVGMMQRWLMAPGAPDVENLSRALTYQALVAPAK